jgi:hypothetical protein
VSVLILSGLVMAFAALAGCGGGSKKPAAASSEEQIKRSWAAFFEGSTPAARKVALLQHGQQFSPVIQAEANSPLAKQAKVTVTKVTLLSPTRAKVLYTITLAGQPALPNQTGVAVLEGRTWRVSDQSFCSLLSLEGAAPPACHA